MGNSLSDAFVPLKLGRETFRISRRTILAAMREFERRYRQNEPPVGTKFAVVDKERLYPPKRILSLATGRPTSDFAGGEFTNSVFRRLGFEVGSAHPPLRPSRKEVDGPVPTVGDVLTRLFSQKWRKLDKENLEVASREGSEFPGVYVIAYEKNIEGLRVDEKPVFYVGMSDRAGLKNCLKQFMDGLEDGKHHSGAITFFGREAKGVAYSCLKREKDFYFAWAPVLCLTTKKGERKPRDLEKMGIVAAAEKFALARILQKTGKEPKLNQQ